jgi:hypothetical protein
MGNEHKIFPAAICSRDCRWPLVISHPCQGLWLGLETGTVFDRLFERSRGDPAMESQQSAGIDGGIEDLAKVNTDSALFLLASGGLKQNISTQPTNSCRRSDATSAEALCWPCRLTCTTHRVVLASAATAASVQNLSEQHRGRFNGPSVLLCADSWPDARPLCQPGDIFGVRLRKIRRGSREDPGRRKWLLLDLSAPKFGCSNSTLKGQRQKLLMRPLFVARGH